MQRDDDGGDDDGGGDDGEDDDTFKKKASGVHSTRLPRQDISLDSQTFGGLIRVLSERSGGRRLRYSGEEKPGAGRKHSLHRAVGPVCQETGKALRTWLS